MKADNLVYKVRPCKDGGAFLLRNGRKIFPLPVSVRDSWNEARRLARARGAIAELYDKNNKIKTGVSYAPVDA